MKKNRYKEKNPKLHTDEGDSLKDRNDDADMNADASKVSEADTDQEPASEDNPETAETASSGENENIDSADNTSKEDTAEESEKKPDESNSEGDESSDDVEQEASAEDTKKADADEASDEGETSDTAESEDAGRMSRRQKKEKKELEKKDERIAQLTNQCQRTMAEFDNYRKRTEKEKSAMYGMGVKDVVEKLLPVIDNFERGFSQVTEDDKEDPFVTGMQAIYKQFQTVLEDIGIKPIEAVGKPFDPNLHNAVMHVEDESVGDSVVVEELQKDRKSVV